MFLVSLKRCKKFAIDIASLKSVNFCQSESDKNLLTNPLKINHINVEDKKILIKSLEQSFLNHNQ